MGTDWISYPGQVAMYLPISSAKGPAVKKFYRRSTQTLRCFQFYQSKIEKSTLPLPRGNAELLIGPS